MKNYYEQFGRAAILPGLVRANEILQKEILATDIARKNPEMPLTAYFDPKHYKLRRVS